MVISSARELCARATNRQDPRCGLPPTRQHCSSGAELCVAFETARRWLIEAGFSLAVRDLWVSGWTPADLADEVRRRTGSIEARELIVRVLLDEDARRSEQARTEEWTQAVTFLAAASAVEAVATGWVARWILLQRDDRAAARAVLDVLDVLEDMRRSAA